MIPTLILITNIAVIAFVFFIGLIMPSLTRRGVVFAVRIPEAFEDDPDVKDLKKSYLVTYSFIGGIFALALAASQFVIHMVVVNAAAFTAGITVQVIIMTAAFLVFRKKMLRLKASKKFMEQAGKQVVVADTTFHATIKQVSWLWFSLPLAVIAAGIIGGFLFYESIPDRFPIHFNMHGEPDGWATKSYPMLFFMPIMQLLITCIMMFVFHIFRRARQQTSAENPKRSALQSRIFRFHWSIFVLVSCVLLVLACSFTHLHMLTIIKIHPSLVGIPFLAAVAIMLVYTLILSVRLGQGGSRIRIAEDSPPAKVITHDDDKYWKAGMFYYNPDDPSVWVEKRFGIGYTLNFANKRSHWIMGGIVVLIFGMLGVSLLIPFLLS